MDSIPDIDSPVWELELREKIAPYLPSVRDWWDNYSEHSFKETGSYELSCYNGLHIRFTRVAERSPIKGIQAFTFVPSAYIQMRNVRGGYLKMIERLCRGGMQIDEFTLICKSNLPSVFNGGQIICIVPTIIYNHQTDIGIWLYLTHEEIAALSKGIVLPDVIQKASLKIH